MKIPVGTPGRMVQRPVELSTDRGGSLGVSLDWVSGALAKASCTEVLTDRAALNGPLGLPLRWPPLTLAQNSKALLHGSLDGPWRY